MQLFCQITCNTADKYKHNLSWSSSCTFITNRYMYKSIWNMACSVRTILRIGEYSLVALQHRRIRYISLRVSDNADAPAAITINSKKSDSATETHGPRLCVNRMWRQMRPAFLFTFSRTDCRCDTSKHQRHPATLHAAWCFNYRYAKQMHANVSKGQTGSWNLTHWFTTLTLPCFKQAYIMYPLHVQCSDALLAHCV